MENFVVAWLSYLYGWVDYLAQWAWYYLLCIWAYAVAYRWAIFTDACLVGVWLSLSRIHLYRRWFG